MITATDPGIARPDELAAIYAQSPRELTLIHEAMRECGLRSSEAYKLDIRHWDRPAGTLLAKDVKSESGQRQIIPVSPALKLILGEAIGDRLAGPIFLSPKACRWTAATLIQEFRKACNSAGVRKQVCLYGARFEWLCRAENSPK